VAEGGGAGAIAHPPQFCHVGKFLAKNAEFGLKIAILDKFRGVTEIFSTHIFASRNFPAAVENCNFLPPTFLTHNATGLYCEEIRIMAL